MGEGRGQRIDGGGGCVVITDMDSWILLTVGFEGESVRICSDHH